MAILSKCDFPHEQGLKTGRGLENENAAFDWKTLKGEAGFLLLAAIFLLTPAAWAGGPKYVAGTAFFDPAVKGTPLHWAGGQLRYYVDQGSLNGSISNAAATAMVDAAAQLWSAVPTAGVTLTDMGQLGEDVTGRDISLTENGITQPYDITAAATDHPLAVIFDADGSFLDSVLGAGSSDPTSCQNNGVLLWEDNLNSDATIAHAVMVLNGLCATNSNLVAMMNYELERAFGRLLGLDYAQVNPGALASGIAGGTRGWPVMQPDSGFCGPTGGVCIPSPATLRYDDIAALNRIYPITAANLAAFPGKQITAAHTVSIQGTIHFKGGAGMQGVNVVARPLDAKGNPLYQYTATFVSGSYFNGNHGNPVTGTVDAKGNNLARWGSDDSTLQGYFDLSGMPLPPGQTSASYVVTFEAVDPMYMGDSSVGPYLLGSPAPSGTLPPISVANLAPGISQVLTVTVKDSAGGGYQGAAGSELAPRPMPASGMWAGRLSQVGQTDWFTLPMRAGRTFTLVTVATDESGAATDLKAMPALGAWDAFDAAGTAPVGAAPALNGWAKGETWLRVSSTSDAQVRIAVADQRGDGRPDYAYAGWVLYADTVAPAHLGAGGGLIVIHGMGFHMADTVLVGGQPAVVTSISPNEITAIAPAAATGVTGSVDVEVDDNPNYYAAAIISGGISYNSGDGDALTLISAPFGMVPIGVPTPFSVTALASDLSPAGGVTVVFTVTSGNATLACGSAVCSVTATGDGKAAMNVTATDTGWSNVTARLTNGSSLRAEFMGGTPPVLSALTPLLSVAAGATVNWTAQALVLNNGAPIGGQAVAWQASGTGIVPQGNTAAITNGSGIAAKALAVGPLTEGQEAFSTACLNGTSQCVAFTVLGARPEYAVLRAVSGVAQSVAMAGTAGQIALRLLDMDGNPMAGGTVTLNQAIYAWAPACPRHGRCAQSELLATQVATATSGLDGLVTFVPASIPGVATMVRGLASSGNTAAVAIEIEQH